MRHVARRVIQLSAVIGVLATPALLRSQSSIPTPESAFGFRAGADYKLATYEQSLAYFRQLDAASDRVTIVEAGKTSQGRPMVFALISSPENLANVDRYRQMNVR